VLIDYFTQEHFSLKALVGNLVNVAESKKQTTLSIVYTRTDASIHSIPTHNANRNLALEDPSATGRLCRLVHDNLDELVVESLSVLKSESMLMSAVESWAKDTRKKVLVLLVDMSTSCAFENINYARMRVEQNVDGMESKSFVLLLHYPSSGRDGCS